MIVVYLIFLAVIQAVTEFLPVSSLGHLCILEQYMGIGHETGLLSETMLHLGSAAAIIFLFRKDLKKIGLGLLGMFMDMTPAILIFTPIFLPIVTQFGMDPIHFGVMMVVNLSVGLCTPPVGSVLFIGCSVAGTKIDQVIRPLLPMFAAMVIVLFLVAFLPDLSLLIPRLFGL